MGGLALDYILDPGRYCVCLHTVRPGWDGPGLIVGYEGDDLEKALQSALAYNSKPENERWVGSEPENLKYKARVYNTGSHKWMD